MLFTAYNKVMKRLWKISIFVIITPLVLFILWMNLTPGHFALKYCGCTVGYYTQKELKEQEEEHKQLGLPCAVCLLTIRETVLLTVSLLDLNR